MPSAILRPVSAENVAVVGQAFAAWDRGDTNAILNLCHEDIVVTQAAEVPGVGTTQHGHAGVLEAFALWPEQWDDFRIEIVHTLDSGDHVVVTTSQSGRGKGSGVEVTTEFTFLFRLRDHRISEWRIFLREQQALEAIESSR